MIRINWMLLLKIRVGSFDELLLVGLFEQKVVNSSTSIVILSKKLIFLDRTQIAHDSLAQVQVKLKLNFTQFILGLLHSFPQPWNSLHHHHNEP